MLVAATLDDETSAKVSALPVRIRPVGELLVVIASVFKHLWLLHAKCLRASSSPCCCTLFTKFTLL